MAEIVEAKLFAYRDRGFYYLHRYVIMPEHLHIILTPSATTTLEKAVQLIKGGSSHEIGAKLESRFPVWHPGFTEHQIRDQSDYDTHAAYIDKNPIKAGLAREPAEYPFCSAHGGYRHDPWPLASEAKAPGEVGELPAGLKPRPLEEERRGHVNYFAYGSNLLTSQMQQRVGSWDSARKARLSNWAFLFNKRKGDGTSAANVHPAQGDAVWGVVYEITEEQLRKLAADHEKGYQLVELEVVFEDGSQVMVRTFVAEADKVQEGLPIRSKYVSKILTGAEEHGLPEAYRNEIARKAQTQGKGGVSTPP